MSTEGHHFNVARTTVLHQFYRMVKHYLKIVYRLLAQWRNSSEFLSAQNLHKSRLSRSQPGFTPRSMLTLTHQGQHRIGGGV